MHSLPRPGSERGPEATGTEGYSRLGAPAK
jgi:hypothetical protein